MEKLSKSFCCGALFAISAVCTAYAGTPGLASVQPDYQAWTGPYLGVNASVIETNVSNANLNTYGFTTAAFGLSGGYHHAFRDAFILGLSLDLNTSPFSNHAFNEKGDEFHMESRTQFFGAILANVGAVINQNFAIINNAGVGYMKTRTTGETRGDSNRFSDHSASFTLPVIGSGLFYKRDNHFYGKVGVNYYIPMSKVYFSTVGLGHATLRKGLLQGGLEVGWHA